MCFNDEYSMDLFKYVFSVLTQKVKNVMDLRNTLMDFF